MLLVLVLFICGAVVMSVEILASRILAPEFGDNLYVWGSLIGTFIGALSVGYWFGGLAADRWPTRKGLAVLTFVSGIVTVVMVYLTTPVNEYIYALDIAGETQLWLKPLTAAAVLYGVPMALLGAVSPYCVRLAAHDLMRLGRRVGSFYAISSLGSIFGTFLTAFYLVGEFRVRATILAEGVLLVCLSVVILVSSLIIERRR